MVEGIKARGHRSAHLIAGAEALAAELAPQLQAGDMIVCLGAGDITKWAAGLAPAIVARFGNRHEERPRFLLFVAS
jgi:UDP-N-acetylmuramate--alanine ligase